MRVYTVDQDQDLKIKNIDDSIGQYENEDDRSEENSRKTDVKSRFTN